MHTSTLEDKRLLVIDNGELLASVEGARRVAQVRSMPMIIGRHEESVRTCDVGGGGGEE